MKTENFNTSILVGQSPQQVYDAINNVRSWWSEEIEGSTDKLHEVFRYHYGDVHRCQIKITELVPAKKVEWLVLDNYFNFIKDKNEWIDNKIVFNIEKKGNQVQLDFTQEGLVPAYECYEVCSDSWKSYIADSLRDLIEKGKGKPNPKEQEGEINLEVMEKNKKYFDSNTN